MGEKSAPGSSSGRGGLHDWGDKIAVRAVRTKNQPRKSDRELEEEERRKKEQEERGGGAEE